MDEENTTDKSLIGWLAIPTPKFLKPGFLSVHCSVFRFNLPTVFGEGEKLSFQLIPIKACRGIPHDGYTNYSVLSRIVKWL